MSRVSIIRICVFVLVGVSLALGIYYWPTYAEKKDKPAPAAHLKAGGTSVVSVIMANGWGTGYRKAKGVEVDYDSTGSTKGVTEMIDKSVAIGFTHAPLTEEQKKKALAKGGEVVHIPVVICAVVPVYNLKELKGKDTKLKFTGEVLADIYLGKIDKWNDPALKKLNDGVELPDTKITVVHREDSSGTTFIFTDYLLGTSEAWKKEYPTASSELTWKVGVAKPRNQGVAEHDLKTEGAIGYVDLVHVYYGDAELDYGAVQNKDNDFILVTDANMTAAAKGLGADIADDLTFRLTNRPGKGAYPICGAVWAVCYQNQSAAAAKDVVDFLTWVTHEGQNFAGKMNYAPLPEEIVQRVDQKLKTIKSAP